MNHRVVTVARSCLLLLVLASHGWAADPNKLFLWEVQSSQGHGYLLGSIHLVPPEFYPLDAKIERAFRESDNLVLEVDIDSIDEGALQKESLAMGLYADGSKLSDRLSAEALERLHRFLSERDIPKNMLEPMKPWMAGLTLAVIEMQRLGFDQEIGIDRHFARLAKHNGHKVHGLESAEFQLGLLSSFDGPTQETALMQALDEIHQTGDQLDAMVEAWRTGDSAGLEEVMLGSYVRNPEYFPIYKTMIIDRNFDMAKKIGDQIASGGSWFVVVGSGHLVGEKGVVALLESDSRGFELNQVSASSLDQGVGSEEDSND